MKFVHFSVINEQNGRWGNSPVSALLPVYLCFGWIDLLSFMTLKRDCSRVHDVWYNYFFFFFSLKNNEKMDGEQVFDFAQVKIFIF